MLAAVAVKALAKNRANCSLSGTRIRVLSPSGMYGKSLVGALGAEATKEEFARPE